MSDETGSCYGVFSYAPINEYIPFVPENVGAATVAMGALCVLNGVGCLVYPELFLSSNPLIPIYSPS